MCHAFSQENEMPTKALCHCSCCADGTGMYCFKCNDKKITEPLSCFNSLKGQIPTQLED